jgi:hypothetical protein
MRARNAAGTGNMFAEQDQSRTARVENAPCHHWNPVGLVFALLHVAGLALLVFHPAGVSAQTDRPSAPRTVNPPTLVIGFTGGFVHSDDLRHSEPQLAQRLARDYGDHVEVAMLENRQREQAHKLIIDWLGRLEQAGLMETLSQPGKAIYGGTRGSQTDRTSRGAATPVATQSLIGEERGQPRIILFGHSWGASAVVYVSRELERDGIPVALTVQVDSVKKHGEDDSVIPANVAEAVNFYQPSGILHGQRRIIAADPSSTTILGNYHFSYHHEPAACHAYPWYNRVMFKGHTAIECDPQVWSQVETLIEARIPQTRPEQTEVAEHVTK